MAIDFDLSDEHKQLRDLCRDFALREIKPRCRQWNEDRRFPSEVFRKLGQLGLCGLLLPPDYGGSGAGAAAYVIAMEELASADQSLAAAWNAHVTIGSLPIYFFGTETQKKRWLPPLARGEYLAGCAFTEPDAGSDLRNIRTAAVWDDNAWVLNGQKLFISNVGTDMSTGPMVLARVRYKEKDEKNLYGFFVVPRDTRGFTIGAKVRGIGWRGLDSRALQFDDCRLSADQLLGERSVPSLQQAIEVLSMGRISIAALAVGLIRACFEASLAHAQERVQFGQPLSKFQATQFKLADMATRLELARLMTLKAAWLYDGSRSYQTEAAMAKLYASETAMWAATEAVQIQGGYGFMEENVVSTYFRDAKVLEIGEGTNEIQRLVIARRLGC